MRNRDCPSDYLFASATGERITETWFSKKFQAYLEFAGLPHVTLHSLRHYAITRLAKGDMFVASLMAGHRNLSTTRRYLHRDADHMRDIVNKVTEPTSAAKKKPRMF